MKRREFITLLGGAAMWPLPARAQQTERIRRVGVLTTYAESDQQGQVRVKAFQRGLQEFGWAEDRNIRLVYRWSGGDISRVRSYAKELVGMNPDAIFASPHPAVEALLEHTRTIPVVAVGSGDFVRAGFAQSHARPGGNVTGFFLLEPTIIPKFLELLKEIAPSVTRVAVAQSDSSTWRGDFAAIEAVARTFAIEPISIIYRDAADIERMITAFARAPNGGIIFPPDAVSIRHRELIVALAAKYRLPAIYPYRDFVTGGGLIFYGPDPVDPWRRAAEYVNRILRGAKPGELPIQAPSKFELGINLKTAKVLGLTVPTSTLLRATEVIE